MDYHDLPEPWAVAILLRANPALTERQAVAKNLRMLAHECIDNIDGGDECQGHDSWLTTLADGMRHAALLLDAD